MGFPLIPAAVVTAVGLAAKRTAAQLALTIAVAVAGKVLAAAAKEGGRRATKAMDQFEEAARRYEDLTAAESDGKKRLRFTAIATGARAAAASFKELSTLIERNAGDAAVESAVKRAAGDLKELVARRQAPTAD